MKALRIHWLVLLLLGLAGNAAAGQKNHEQASHSAIHAGHSHHHAEEGDVAVETFKKSVPAEYRIMNRTPVIDDQASLLSGRKLYALHCADCHGSRGRGDGAAAAGLKTPPGDFLAFERSNLFAPGEKYWIIAKGSRQLGMPAFPDLGPEDAWHLVNYLLALQNKFKSEGYDAPPHKH